MRLALGVEYDGGAFSGFQFQSHAPSVQASLEAALSEIADQPIRIEAAGRTDAGVHATQQIVAFDLPPVHRPRSAWIRGTNTLTPEGLAVRWAEQVPADFHPRFQATARRYMYLFLETEVPSPLLAGRVVESPDLDDEAMHRAAQCLIGEQDFSAFRAAGCQAAGPFRCVHRLSVLRAAAFVFIDITANAFLLHMVRNIAGSLWEVGRGRRSPDWIAGLLAGRDRAAAAPTAPPGGLYLVDVRYPDLALPAGQLPAPLRALGSLDRF